MTDQRMFWLVWNPMGQSPTFQHWTQEAADREATRLALAYPGSRFYVLCAERCIEKNETRVTELAPQEDCPNMPF